MIMTERTIHQGRNVKRFREMNQQRVSLLEQKETIDVRLLQQISAALKIPVEAIENFDEEAAINIISSSFDNGSVGVNYFPTFHPVEKLMQLHEEKIALYERMLKEKDDMMEKLERLLEKGK